MSRAEITLKTSGATVVFDAEELTWRRDRLQGVSLHWTTPEKGATRRLMHVDISEVAAIVWLEE